MSRTDKPYTLREGGYYGHFWVGNYKITAYNEGGYGPIVLNLKLWQGLIPVGFYLAVKLGSRWVRFSRGFSW